ncbi:hypothetical protein [Virgibacillus dokdonensis]|uniref:hypothetical protein n=1 Tax=Virgibacillus dokdonensis TaxID=302167 RepID=UPI00098BC02D|nr:hypothetical protein [Virgibacillus dokdonensis]
MNIHMFTNGPLSKEVSQILKKNISTTTSIEISEAIILNNPDLEAAELIVVISDNPCVSFCKKISDYSYKEKKIFVPIIIDQPNVIIGPIWRSAEDACYHCYIDRILQHSPVSQVLKEVWQFYDHNLQTFSTGYHPSEPSFLASWLLGNLSNCFSDVRGQVIQLNLVTREPISSQVIGVHGCPRCGLGREEKTRGYIHIQEELFN